MNNSQYAELALQDVRKCIVAQPLAWMLYTAIALLLGVIFGRFISTATFNLCGNTTVYHYGPRAPSSLDSTATKKLA